MVDAGAHILTLARNVLKMEEPQHRLDTGTWDVTGISMGYAIAAAVTEIMLSNDGCHRGAVPAINLKHRFD